MTMLRDVLLSLSVCLTPTLSNVKVEESNTGAVLSFPDVSDGDLFNVTWEVEPAAFGYADYGGTLEAYLVLPANKSMHLECEEEPDDINEFITYIQTYQGFDVDWVLVIDRGDCYFATKVYNAQRMGAAGVIMLDYKQEGFIIMWEPDDFEHDVDIPSVMLKNDHAQALMKHLGVKQWDPTDMSNCTYPRVMGEGMTGKEFVETRVIIEWGLPHDDDRVEWELWTSSNDDRTIEFKRNFKQTSIYLNDENYTLFQPHYYVLNGSHWKCDTSSLRCGNQCTNSGRYCAVDPEKDLDLGISGADVVQEDLRQICVWKYANETVQNESVWWDYSVLWNDNCFNETTNELIFNTECSFEQMAYLEKNGFPDLSEKVKACINSSGGYNETDGVNSLLEYEVRFRESSSIHVLPTFRVNEFMIYGEVDCDVVTEQGCSVLDSICSGFIEGTAPDLCFATPSPTMMDCNETYKDCAGNCFGTHQTDRCGQCLDPSDTEFNSCVGCDNVTYSANKTNPCGICMDQDAPDFETRGDDCRGKGKCDDNWGTDKCGECLWVASLDWNSCVGCDGVANSNASYHCGLCVAYGSDEWKIACEEDASTGGSNSNSSNGTSTAALVIGVIAFIIIVAAGLIIYRLHKKQKDQSQAFENILKTYNLMDENPAGRNGADAGTRTKKKEKLPDRDADELDVEEENQVV